MKTVAIIQARMDSERLPGKVLEKIGDATVLGWVVYRTRQIKLDQIVVATTGLPSDDRIVEECGYLDVECFRGSADDVLDRYYQAAKKYGATHVLRVTADCPLLSPDLNQRIIDRLIEAGLDYVSSHGWPDGVGQEAFTIQALERAFREATEVYDREHVIPWMTRYLLCITIERDIGRKLSVDTKQDLDWLRWVYDRQPGRFGLGVPAG